jgi:hypothetical protein
MKHSLSRNFRNVLLTLLFVQLALPLVAQTSFTLLHAPSTVHDGEEFNVFFKLDASVHDTANALILALPRGIQALRLYAIDSPVRFFAKTLAYRNRTYSIFFSSEPLPASLSLVLTLRASESFSERHERLHAYLTCLHSRDVRPALIDTLDVVAPMRAALSLTLLPKWRHENTAANFDSLSQTNVFLPASRAFVISLQRNFTAEFWLRSTALGRVVLSTWSGATSDAYALEVELLADGRIGTFFGTPFSFSRLMSRTFVGDGVWHHCAITHDSVQSVMRLFIDGALHDSARTQIHRAAFTPSLERRTLLYLGSRAGRERFFHGELDELKIYRRAKTAQELATLEILERETDASLLVSESFSLFSRSALAGARPDIVRASLAAATRIRDFRAELQNGSVQLSWEFTGPPNTSGFTVEQSTDGNTFQSIGTVEFSPMQSFYRFTDRPSGAAPKVVFYRIRANLPGRSALFSPTLKVGLATTKQFSLHQNTPNPFNPTTTIVYELFSPSSVELIIYNMLGNEITRIRHDWQPAGLHKYVFNAANFELSSGIYLYRLQTDTGSETRKMILMK